MYRVDHFHLVVKNNWDALHVIGLWVLWCTCQVCQGRSSQRKGNSEERTQRTCKQGRRKGILGSRPFFSILLLTLEIFSFFRNGRWRSEWSVSFQPSGGNVEVTGILKVQVMCCNSKSHPQILCHTSPVDTTKPIIYLFYSCDGKIFNMAAFYLSFLGSLLWRWKCSTCHNQRGEGRRQSHCKYWLCVHLFSLSPLILIKVLTWTNIWWQQVRNMQSMSC